MGKQISKHKRRLEEEDEETVREDYVKRMRDNYPLIVRTLMHDIIVSIDKNGNFVFVNDAAVEFLGKSSEELVGANFIEYLHPEDKAKAMGIIQELIGGKEQVKGFIFRVKSPEGFRSLAMNGIAVFDDKRNYIGAHAIGKDLTDLLRTEEELKWSKKQFQSIFEVMVDPVVIVNMNGNILELSQSAEQILGFPKKELVGKHFLETDAVTAESKAIMAKNLEKLKTGHYIEPHPIEVITKDGTKLLYELNTARINHKGEPAILAIFRNITEQKKAEEQLQASEERFNYFLENAPEAIWVQDLIGTFLDGNKRSEELTGYKKEELIGKNMLEILVPPKSIPKLMEAFKPNKHGGISGPTEVALIRKDGSRVPVEASTIPIGRDGKIEIIGIARDITERKKAEEELRENEKRFRELSDLLPEVVFEADATGKLTFVNQIAFDRFGYNLEDFDNGVNAVQMLIPADRDRAKDEMDGVLSGADIGFTEYTALRKDGSTFPIMIHSTPIIRGNMPVGLRGIIVDITERKKAEEVLRESEKRFRSTLDSMLEGCQIVDYNWRYIYVNDAGARHARLAKKDLLGKTIMEAHPGIEKTELFSVFSKCMNERVPTHMEYEYLYRNGEKNWFELSIEPMSEGIFVLSIDINDRKEVEDALHQEREMLETVTANVNAGLVIISKDYRVLWANKVLDYLGDIEGKICYSCMHQRTSVCPGCGAKEIFETGKELLVHEQVALGPNGQKIWLEITATAIRDETGEIVAASEMSIDITKRKRIENELKENLHKFRTIFEGSTDGILAADPNTFKFAFANPRMHEITGYPFGELINLTMADITRKEDLPFAIEQFKKQLEGKLTLSRNVPILRKDNTIVYCDISSRLLKIGDEQYLVGFFRDVTEQKKAEDALRESEEKYREIINAMNDTSWVIDFDGNLIDVNDAAVKVMGYSREELLSIGLTGIDYNLDPQEIKALIEDMPANKIQVFETVHTTKDGRNIPVEISSSLVTYRGKRAILSIARDITERKKAQEAINETNGLLKQSNKELESYTYVVSHDLKAPLRTIRSFGSFILEDYGNKLDETGKDYLNRMVNASSHMDSMIEDLLVLSRVGRKFTEFEKVDLNKLLDEILADLEATIKERNAKVVVDKLPTLYVHRVWKRQLFMNLISNALKFNESKTPKIEVLYEERENDHLFKIRDNGIGIEKKYLERIFNLFERAPTEKKYEGTGAGLAICKKIVEQFGGKIWVESTPGKGSTFIFTIPKELKQVKEK